MSLSSNRKRSEGWYSPRRGCAIAEAVPIQTHILSFFCSIGSVGLGCGWEVPVPWMRLLLLNRRGGSIRVPRWRLPFVKLGRQGMVKAGQGINFALVYTAPCS